MAGRESSSPSDRRKNPARNKADRRKSDVGAVDAKASKEGRPTSSKLPNDERKGGDQ